MWQKYILTSVLCLSVAFCEDFYIACDESCALSLDKKLNNAKNTKAITHNPFAKQEVIVFNDEEQEESSALILEAIMNKKALISGSWYAVGQTPHFVILHIAPDSITINKNGQNTRIKITEQIGL